MQNIELWKPSKFELRSGRLHASRNRSNVGTGSRLNVELIARFYERSLREHVHGDLLDLGCGSVPLFGTYRDLAESVTCVDWDNSPHAINHIDIAHDLNRPLPLASAMFDTIILSDVLEHLAEPDQIWSEMARVLRPGGRVILNVPFYYQLHEKPFDFYRYTEFALRRFAERHGFVVLELEAVGGAIEILVDVGAKLLARSRLGRIPALLVQRLCLALLATSFGRRYSQKTALSFPFGYVMVTERQREPTKTW